MGMEYGEEGDPGMMEEGDMMDQYGEEMREDGMMGVSYFAYRKCN